MKKEIRWLSCPICGNKTRTKIRDDTVLQNFLLFCPKCKNERLVAVDKFQVIVLQEPDAKMQSR